MADDNNDSNIRELKRKVSAHVRKEFGGDFRKAFNRYANLKKKNNKVDRDELDMLLKNADVGTFATRWKWVDGVLAKLDKDRDGTISLVEFESVLNERK